MDKVQCIGNFLTLKRLSVVLQNTQCRFVFGQNDATLYCKDRLRGVNQTTSACAVSWSVPLGGEAVADAGEGQEGKSKFKANAVITQIRTSLWPRPSRGEKEELMYAEVNT